MRIANLSGRLVLVAGERGLDVETASGGLFSADPAAAFERWDELHAWADGVDVATDSSAIAVDPGALDAPSPRPRQIVCIGLNYADHAAEANLDLPTDLVVFTKFASALAGADVDVRLPGDTVDWESELVIVIGRGGRNISVDDATDRVAGYTVGQDLSERTVQWQGTPAQFSMGKSFKTFAPTGPVVVSTAELGDPQRLRVTATITGADGTGTTVQDGTTADMVFGVAEIVSRLSRTIELFPGDLIFTGTPAGVGAGMSPKRFLRAGETLTTEIESIGTIVQRFSL